ncbi:exopolyphosphatase / guanosine-5'-triphosphate,3'-diphosphate pyrophosphatase [Devosia lucknowensis]|uniref:Exopolyphosphatase / guanosine-5'-triphosphate,3'-diphosphate pyrophosphatase n=1 Tax=Devosia lucknowensis TaxID=1096929 RepID=A0A1Y6EQH8_9HYPH|nr:Ppx/GppA phosphatase family protein [Devosia lucknowensis]SMQ64827.1 exopolyphosphatase / guanosine-5'-triphosphate,3'-diphosphate pyrophosphatase [Devosia lucknowensis]
MTQFWGVDADPTAQGRIKGARPVAVLDIGSNSVRLVVYERHARALTPLYNEKSACALGRGMAQTGRLAESNMAIALEAMKRFALVARMMRVGKVYVLATSAVRDAANRAEFVSAVEAVMEAPVRVLSGEEEAHYAALGVVAGIPGFAGVVGDLGGGSLEFSDIANGLDTNGESFELGVIRLQDDADGSPKKAAALVRERLVGSIIDGDEQGGQFAAIGGTWRSLAKLHQGHCDYPLHMVQDYVVQADEMIRFCDDIVAADSLKNYPGSGNVSNSRRELVPFGAAALSELLKVGKFGSVVFSALGVREGYLYGKLDDRERAIDPLIQGAEELSILRSRSPAHANDLIEFTSQYFDCAHVAETPQEMRLRIVACLLADIGWRSHPDYRGPQSVDAVAYGSLTGVDHPGRSFLAQVMAIRYDGLKSKAAQALTPLGAPELTARARLIGALMRVAYPMTAAMPGILPRAHFSTEGKSLLLNLPSDFAFLNGDHLRNRLRQFAEEAGFAESRVVVS